MKEVKAFKASVAARFTNEQIQEAQENRYIFMSFRDSRYRRKYRKVHTPPTEEAVAYAEALMAQIRAMRDELGDMGWEDWEGSSSSDWRYEREYETIWEEDLATWIERCKALDAEQTQ